MRYQSKKSQAPKTTATQQTASFIAQNQGFTLWAISSLLSGIVGLSGSLISPPLSQGAIAVFGGTQAAAYVASEKNKHIARLEKAEKADRSKLEADQQQLAAERAALQKQRAELDKIASTQASTQVALKTRADTYQSEIRSKLTLELRAESDRRIREAEQAAAASVREKQKQLDDAIAARDAMREEFSAKYDATKKAAVKVVSKAQSDKQALGEKAAQTIKVGNEVLASERQDVNKVLERLSAEIQGMSAELASQKELVAKLQAPKLFRMKTFEANTGNQIQQFLCSRGVVVGCDSIGKIHRGVVPLYYEAINCDLKDVQSELEAIYLHVDMAEMPTAEIENGLIKITVHLSSESVPKAEKTPKMKPPEELIRILREVNHLRVSAPTDSGKSTLMSNILYLLNAMFEGKQTTTLYDPKYPDSDWPIKPTFNEVEQCVLNAPLVGDTVKARLDEARKAAENGTAAPEHNPHLFVVDEIEFMYTEALAMAEMGGDLKNTAKVFKRSMKRGLKVGRSRNLKLLYVMQSHLCSDAGFNSADFLQSTNIFLGSNIPMVLAPDGELKGRFSDSKRVKLLSEFQQLSAQGEKYIMLIVTANSREAFIMIPPKPNYFAEKDNALNTTQTQSEKAVVADSNSQPVEPQIKAADKPKCKYCGSENVSYKRKKGSKKQYTCDEPLSLCNFKTFTI